MLISGGTAYDIIKQTGEATVEAINRLNKSTSLFEKICSVLLSYLQFLIIPKRITVAWR